MTLILASQSPYRRRLLENIQIQFLADSPQVDEEQLKKTGPSDLVELTRYLAEKKAQSLVSRHPQSLILGSDQIAEVEGERLDKPGTPEAAKRQLRRLSGRTHRLITSLALVSPLKTVVRTDVTEVTFRLLTDEEINAYVELDRPFDSAGSYKIEMAGLALVDKLKTRDPSAIQGLSILDLNDALEELGLKLTSFWRKS